MSSAATPFPASWVTPDSEQIIERLALAYGIQPSYWTLDGNENHVSPLILLQLLDAMGVLGDDGPQSALNDVHQRYWKQTLDPVCVINQESLQGLSFPIRLALPVPSEGLNWTLTEESGKTYSGVWYLDAEHRDETTEMGGVSYGRFQCRLPHDASQLPLGYHTLVVTQAQGEGRWSCRVIVTPSACYLPGDPASTQWWGPAVQLYSLRTSSDWGIGDFTGLKGIISWSAKQGASLVGLNPLNTLNLVYPEGASPYSPVTRFFLNPLYIDVEAVPEYSKWYQELSSAEKLELEQAIQTLQEQSTVAYGSVWALKSRVLRALYARFQTEHLQKQTPRAQGFQDFVEAHGNLLVPFSRFQALQEVHHGNGWTAWGDPHPLKAISEISDPALLDLAGFYQYLQWLAHGQLQEATSSVEGTGLYLDLPVGAQTGGFDTLCFQDAYAMAAKIGAPPDPLGPLGQDWGLPPWVPHRLQEMGYEPFIQTLRQSMAYAKAIRLDHVLGLYNLFWIPPGGTPKEGTYVRYPFDEFLGIIALESHRAQCLVIGEDLGTVPGIVREKMAQWQVLSYRVTRWERCWDQDGQPYVSPEHYPVLSLVTPSTHDTPTLAGMVRGDLYSILHGLQMLDDGQRHGCLEQNDRDMIALLQSLKSKGLFPDDIELRDLKAAITRSEEDGCLHPIAQTFLNGVHRFTAQARSCVAMYPMDDILGEVNQQNVPGTADAPEASVEAKTFPNWRKRFSIPLEQWDGSSACSAWVQAIGQGNQERNRLLATI